ncbi:MAG: ComEC/Rec2 family competence protein [bacterium]
MFEILRHRPLLQMALAFIVGITLTPYVGLWIIIPICLLSVFAFYQQRVWITILLMFITLGMMRVKLEERVDTNSILRCPISQELKLKGIVTSEPIILVMPPFTRYQLAVKEVDNLPVSGTIITHIKGSADPPRYGEVLEMYGVLDELIGNRSPGKPDMREYMRLHGIERVLTVKDIGSIRSLGMGSGWFLTQVVKFRSGFKRVMASLLSPEEANLIGGMFLGIQSDVPDDLKNSMQLTGTYHILSVSGFHVLVLWLMLFWLAQRVGLSKRGATIILIPVLALYAIFAGGQAPVVRASLALALYSSAFLFRKEPDPLTAVGGAALAILLFVPHSIYDMSFQLSFIIVAVIILWGWRFHYLLSPPIPKRRGYITRFVLGSLVLSLAAQLGSAPLIAYYFNQLSLISPLANLPIALLSTVAIWCTPFLWILGSLTFGLSAHLAFVSLHPVLLLFTKTVHFMAQIPYACILVPAPPVWWLAIYYLALLAWAKEAPNEGA